MDIASLLSSHAADRPGKTAVQTRGRSMSFRELARRAFQVSEFLERRGVVKGTHVGIFLPNSVESVWIQLGILCRGAVLVPLDYMLSQEEVIAFLHHSGAALLFFQPKKGIDAAEVRARCPHLQSVVRCGDSPGEERGGDLDELVSYSGREPKGSVSPDDPAALFYTSGSTGRPKGVVLSFGHLDNPVETIGKYLQVEETDVFLCGGVPFSHVGGLDYLLLTASFGTTLVLMERFHPLEFLRNIAEFGVTIFCIVPAMYVAILALKEYERFDLSSLRYAVVFGAPSSPALLCRFHRMCPNAGVLNGWGMTETAAPNTFSPRDEEKLSTIGRFELGTEARLSDDAGREISGPGEGELWVRGPAVMKEYFKDLELTRQTITPEGWLKTGDIARRDREGIYTIVGRKKDMLKVAGEIVFCAEVEEALQMHPEVREAAVIGVPDRFRGEVPKAFVVLRDEAAHGGEHLREFLRARLAHFKIPHFFQVCGSLPKNRTGKIDKRLLRKTEESV
ncbi:MAG: AMP-binding protein [Candidatus Omnitrophica bacterium]|nr:AMP-binding protein [Candidatus Omnitrophota bacterium]